MGMGKKGIVISALLLLAILGCGWKYYSHLNLTIETPTLIRIPVGDGKTIISSLRRQGLPLWYTDRFFFRNPLPGKGWIRIEKPLRLKDLFGFLHKAPCEKTRRVVMYSGDSLDDFSKTFSRQTQIPIREIFEEYFRFSPYVDGGILAGYYRLPYRLDAGAAMAAITEDSEKHFAAIAEKYLGSYDPAEFKRYLVVASIIQRETWHEEEMPLISAVIYNRLKLRMKLQMDATLNYGPFSHIPVTPARIRLDTSRFNTYRFRGLPPEPLGSVTPAALEAAFVPAKSDALYFVRNTRGTHDFSSDYAGHLANISRIRAKRTDREHSGKRCKNTEKNGTGARKRDIKHKNN